MSDFIKQCKTTLILLALLTFLTGIIYPLVITGIAQLLFPQQANGSLIADNGHILGSKWIGQSFTDMSYFWGRPSATTPFPYNAENASGSHLGPSHPLYIKQVKERIVFLQQSDPLHASTIPIDLVTASGSGLDPEISPFAAMYQAPRIAKYRHLSLDEVKKLIHQLTYARSAQLLGEARVNVLRLNMALDNLQPKKG